MQSVINAQGSLWTNTDNQVDEQGNALDRLTLQEKIALSAKMAKGDLPDGANIAKAIVEGYEDGLMIGGAFYLGPATSFTKMVTGGVISEGANAYFQWENLNKPGNENESWNYKSSAAAFAGGMLSPGRKIPANIGVNMGGAWYSDGLDMSSQAGAAFGGAFGGAFGKYVPMGMGKYSTSPRSSTPAKPRPS